MISQGYLNPRHERYFCYFFDEEITLGEFDFAAIIEAEKARNAEYAKGMPVYMNGGVDKVQEVKNMKKLALCILLSMITCFGFAKTRRYYCEVKGIEKDFGKGLKIIFDFGERTSYTIWGNLSRKLKFVDENGEVIKFHSMVEATLNVGYSTKMPQIRKKPRKAS